MDPSLETDWPDIVRRKYAFELVFKFYARGRGRLQQVPVHTLQLMSSPPPLPQFKGIVNGEAIGLNGAYSVKLACNAVPDNHPNRFDAIASTQDKR